MMLLTKLQTLSLLLLPHTHAFSVSNDRHCGASHKPSKLPASEKSKLDASQPSIYEIVHAQNKKKAAALTSSEQSIYHILREQLALRDGQDPVEEVVIPEDNWIKSSPPPVAVNTPQDDVVVPSPPTIITSNPPPVVIAQSPPVVEPPIITVTPPVIVPVVKPPVVVASPPVTPPIVMPPIPQTPPTGPQCRTAAFVDASFIARHQDKNIPEFIGGMISDSSAQFMDQFGFGFDLVQVFQNIDVVQVPRGGSPIEGVNSDIARYNGANEYCAIILFTAEVLGGVFHVN